MSNDELRHEEIQYEHTDLSAGAILGFLVGLAITGLMIHIILAGMYRYLDTYEKAHQPAQNPLVKAVNADARQAVPEDANKFPLPRLETNERGQLFEQRMKEEETLNTYGWVDQKGGVAHIPIDRAMKVIAQRGLPTAPPNAAAGSAGQKQDNPAAKTEKAPPQGRAKQ
jgi:hypothetical protein